MTPFEEQLKQALAHREPSPDFAARVIARAEGQRELTAVARMRGWLSQRRIWRLIPVMAAFVVMTGGTVYERRQHAAHGEAAKEKLLIAMRIAGVKLHRAQHRVFDIQTAEVTQ